MHRIAQVALGIVAIGIVGGCAGDSRKVLVPRGKLPEEVRTEMPVSGHSDASALMPQFADLPSLATIEARFGAARQGKTYRELASEDTVALAAEHSSVAKLLLQEKQALGAFYLQTPKTQQETLAPLVAMQQRILVDASLDARNRTAQVALDLYYRLAQTELLRVIAAEALVEVGDSLEKAEKLGSQGLPIGTIRETMGRQQLELRGKVITLESLSLRLNRELRDLLHLAPNDDTWRIWPTSSLEVLAEEIDRDIAVKEGLVHNPELVLLRHVIKRLNSGNVAAVRTLLGRVEPLLGSSFPISLSPLKSLLATLHDPCGEAKVEAADLTIRSLQLQETLKTREAQVTREILDGIEATEDETRHVALLRDQLAQWDRELRILETRERMGESTLFDISKAKLQQLETRRALVEHVIAWHMARVKIRAAQGHLLLEAGYQSETPLCESDGDACEDGVCQHACGGEHGASDCE